jgi:hypothetical protein
VNKLLTDGAASLQMQLNLLVARAPSVMDLYSIPLPLRLRFFARLYGRSAYMRRITFPDKAQPDLVYKVSRIGPRFNLSGHVRVPGRNGFAPDPKAYFNLYQRNIGDFTHFAVRHLGSERNVRFGELTAGLIPQNTAPFETS